MPEMFRPPVLTVALVCLPLLAGCAKEHAKTASKTEASATDSATTSAETTLANPETTVAENEPPYKTTHDAKAVYGLQDLPVRGSYLKLDFNDLSTDQLNRVIHRLRTEDCTCGCQGDLIDQCLVNDPSCTTAVTLAKQIIREEKMKS